MTGLPTLEGGRIVFQATRWTLREKGMLPRTGLDTFAFQTAYTGRDSHRLNVKGALDRWADPVLGDPSFYAARLKPLETELADYAKRVTPEMTDADVNDIFVHALPRWIGLKYEIDALRRDWLLKKNAQ